MSHGIQEFFLERARSRRRVSVLSVCVGVGLLALIEIAQLPIVRHGAAQLALSRFGVAGPTRYVPLVRLEAEPGFDEPLLDVGRVQPVAEGGGAGRGEPKASRSSREPKRTGPWFHGPGDAPRTLVARALSGQGQVPIFQSNELVIEELVRPEYPEDARQRGIEGKVAVLALVDTAGNVVEAEVMTGSGEPQLDRAAQVAVRRCRFQPYREHGERREVYAIFRFAFRIY